MAIVDQIQTDMVAAMKAKESERLGALRMIKTALKNEEINQGKSLDDDAAVKVLTKLAKQRKESIEQFEKGGRTDLADKERAELKVLDGYLPSAPSDEEVAAAVTLAIAKTGASSPKQMGLVMKEVQAAFAGRPVDGKALSALVRSTLEASP